MQSDLSLLQPSLPKYALDHVGIAVAHLETAITTYAQLWGFKILIREELEAQGVQLAFLAPPELSPNLSLIELLAPLTPESKLHSFIAKRGEGLHHICWRVQDINAELQRLAAAGVRLVDKIPRHGAFNSRIAFLHPSANHGVLVELCERDSTSQLVV